MKVLILLISQLFFISSQAQSRLDSSLHQRYFIKSGLGLSRPIGDLSKNKGFGNGGNVNYGIDVSLKGSYFIDTKNGFGLEVGKTRLVVDKEQILENFSSNYDYSTTKKDRLKLHYEFSYYLVSYQYYLRLKSIDELIVVEPIIGFSKLHIPAHKIFYYSGSRSIISNHNFGEINDYSLSYGLQVSVLHEFNILDLSLFFSPSIRLSFASFRAERNVYVEDYKLGVFSFNEEIDQSVSLVNGSLSLGIKF